MSITLKKQKILIVDDIPDNIHVLMGLLKGSYSLIAATNGFKAIEAAKKFPQPDMILLDVMMPDLDGYEVCKRLKADENTKDIPIIFITALGEDSDEEKGLLLGAVDYITKPFNPVLIKMRIKNHLELKAHRDNLDRLVKERTKELHDTRLEVIRKLGLAAEYKDNETGMHIIRMSHYCRLIGLAYGFTEEQGELIFNASPMHDIGKIGVPDNILQKPGKLDAAEWEIIKKHSEYGYKIIGEHHSELLKTAGAIAYEHHEKWNGSGYPRGLKGEDINIFGRVTALADVFDALTSRRPYKDPWPVDEVLAYIENESGKHFDPSVVSAFQKILPDCLEVMNRYSENESSS